VQTGTTADCFEGSFPVVTPECFVQLRAAVCAQCLANTAHSSIEYARRLALDLLGHVAEHWRSARHDVAAHEDLTGKKARRTRMVDRPGQLSVTRRLA
jgi:hypothetical protein